MRGGTAAAAGHTGNDQPQTDNQICQSGSRMSFAPIGGGSAEPDHGHSSASLRFTSDNSKPTECQPTILNTLKKMRLS